MKFKPSVLMISIFGMLLFSVLPMCSNPVIVSLIEGDQKESSPGNGPERIPVSGVSLNLTTLTLLVSETETLKATVHNNATNKAVTWTSSNDLVATVSGSGLVSALAIGSATITVKTVDGNHTASCDVTIKKSTGEADAPFLIRNEFELRKVGAGTDGWNLSAHYELVVDITLTKGDWTPIGNNSSNNDATSFTGSFNGNNKTITGLSINKPNADYQGMFGYIGQGGEVKNLTLADCNVSGKESVGGVAGWLFRATIINCRIVGNVSGNMYVGGVGGANQGTVENCYFKGNVNGKSNVVGNGFVGGVVGFNYQGIITNCNAEGDVSGGFRAVGGVVGGNSASEITNCYATANVYGKTEVGGVVGNNNGTVENSYATGNVSGTDNVGGVVGYNFGGTVINSHAVGNVSGNDQVGGVAGYSDFMVGNCYATGNVSGIKYVGGVVGYSEGSITNCYATGDVDGTVSIGGVVGGVKGWFSGYGIKNCVALNPNINSMDTQYGRIIGYIDSGNLGTITNNYARRDMKHNNSAAEWFNSTNDRDGADITPAEYSLESWWSSLTGFDFSATGVWAWHNANKLPILRGLGTQNPKVSAFAAVETTFVVSGTAFPMVWINAGIFLMGSPENEPYRNSFETLHEVTLTSGFYMGKYEVTQAQYEMVMGVTIAAQQALATNPSTWNYGQGDYYPMYYVSWYDAIVFCNKLSILEGLSPVYRINGSTDPAAWGDVPTSSDATWNNVEIVPGSNGYRLPTGAQWEYSCRAGTTEAFNWGTNYVNSTQAKYDDPLERSSVVGFYAPNAWGLYDMHGNVSEWCWDWWYDYSDSGDRAVTDPSGPSSGDRRIFRGGGFRSGGVYLRSASWSGGSPEVRHEDRGGFRVIRPYK